MKVGYEVDPTEYAPFLGAKLAEYLGYDGFEAQWLQKAWMNGFQDHTYLFLVTANSPALREAIENATGEEPIQASYFRNGGYLGPSTAPRWWDTAKLDATEARYFERNSDFWRFTWIDEQLYIVYSN